MSETNYPNNSYYKDPYDFNTKWANIDVHLSYQFDNQPTNIVMTGDGRRGGTGGRDTNGYYNDLYQVSFRLQNKQLKGWQSWMNWFEKIQPDYKFLVVDERNSQTVVFQNVDDPWMFTQYIYKGIGKIFDPYAGKHEVSDSSETLPYDDAVLDFEFYTQSLNSKQYLVIQPGLYDFVGVPLNQSAKDMDKDDGFTQWQTEQSEGEESGDSDDNEEFIPTSYKKVREKGWYKPQFGQYQQSRYSTGVDGSVLYRGQICVQCNKWGQHGNVPAHAVNMIAPKDYVQGNTKLVLRAMTRTTYGIPIYVDQFGYGYITVSGGKYYVVDSVPSPIDDSIQYDQDGKITKLATAQYTQPQAGSGNQILKNFTKTTSSKIKCRMIGTDIVGGQVVYNGCKYFGVVQEKNGKKIIGCTLQKNMTLQQKQYAKCDGNCKNKNTACKYFVQRGKTIAYRYQCLPTNYVDDDTTNAQLNRLATVCMLGASTVVQIMAMQSNNKDYRQAGGFSQTTQTTYQYVEQPLNGIEVYLPRNSQNNKGAVITRGTGQSAFEKPGLKVRSIYDGDMSQINYHRWLNKILPCYNKKYCNQTIGTNEATKSPVFTNSGCSYMDLNQQNQIVSKTNPFCPYYTEVNKSGIGCPYATVNKTAMDFARINNFFYQSFFAAYALPIANYFLASINKIESVSQDEEPIVNVSDLCYATDSIYATIAKNELSQGTGILVIYVYYSFYKLDIGKDSNGNITYTRTDEKNFVSDKQAIVQLSKIFGIQQQVLQQCRISVGQQDEDIEKDFFLCTIRLKAQNYSIAKKIDYNYKETQLLIDMFMRYNAYDLGSYSQSGASKPSLISKWFVKVSKSSLPQRDPTIIDNQIKFLGGYHPQYSAYSVPPDQILYKKQVPYDQQITVQAKADENQWGNSPTGAGKQVQYGYFIQQNGQWMLDGSDIGDPITAENCYDSIDGRAESPTRSYQGGTCIGNRWQNSLIDPQAEKPQKKKIVNCVFYTNDTKSSIDYLRANPPTVQDQDSEQQRVVPVRISYPQALPLQRDNYAYCETCDTVLALRFLKLNVTNKPKGQVAPNGNMKCPWCGNGLIGTGKGATTKIPRTKAMGRVVVWGLPGTIVKTDSYFWKSPAMVSNALIQQMRFKLGDPSNFGGGYSHSGADADSEKIDTVPFIEQVGKYSKGMTDELKWQLYSVSSSSTTSLTSLPQYQNPNRIATNPSLPANILQQAGISANGTDSRVINPFDDKTLTNTGNDGLKMVSADYITSLRNLLQPALGYCVGKRRARGGQTVLATGDVLSDMSQNPGNPGQYQMYRVKYDDRKQLSHVKYWVKKRCACSPLILAYCGDQNNQTSCKIQYPSGDAQTGDMVKYYPPDPKWWFKKQWVGGMHLTLSGNPYHFDRQGFDGGRFNSYGGIKQSMVSQAYMLPHGFVPLDKQVVAAYLYFNGYQNSCYQPSIGQIQYPSGRKVTLYLHFHPYTTQHESYGLNQQGKYGPHKHEMDDNLVYDDYDFSNPAVLQKFKKQRNIIDADDIGPNSDIDITKHKLISYFDKYGDKYYIDDKTGLPIYHRLYKKRHPQYFIQTQDIHQFKWVQDNLPYTTLANKTNMSLNAGGLNYTHQSKDYGTSALPDCLKWNGFGTDIIQTKSQNQIWKNYTKQQFEKMQDRYMSHVSIQIDTGDGDVNTYSFDQYYSQFNGVLQQQMQSIPGYFDMSQFNSSGFLKKYQNKSSKSTNIQGNYQQFIVTQASTTGADDGQDAGNGDKIFDITQSFKKVYNDRVQRHYHGKLSQKPIKTALKQTYQSEWTGVSQSQSEESKQWSANFNNRLKTNGYYLLNANYWYPNLNQDGVVQTSVNGEKITFNTTKMYFSQKTRTFYTLENKGGSITISCRGSQGESFSHSKTFDIDDQVNEIDSKTLVSYMNQVLKQAQTEKIVVQQQSGNIIITVGSVVVNQKDVKGTVSFTFSGLKQTPSFSEAIQDCNRVISYSGYKDGKHPKGLTHFSKTGQGLPNPSSWSWTTSSLQQQPQQVVFDLIQPPFEKQRRDYLSDRGSISYDQSKCQNQNCPAYNQLQGTYAKMRGSSASSKCLACGLDLQAVKKDCDGIDSWWYTDMPQNDVVIAGLQIQTQSHSQDKPIAPISVYVSSDNKQWQCILSLTVYSGSYSKSYKYNDVYQTENTSSSNIKDFDGSINFLDYKSEGSSSNDNDHGKLIRGRYLKVVTMPQPTTVTCTAQSYTFGSKYIIFNETQIQSLGVQDGQLRGKMVKMTLQYMPKSTDDKQSEWTTVVVTKTVRNNIGSNIYIDPLQQPQSDYASDGQYGKDPDVSSLKPQVSNIYMDVTLYYSNIDQLKVYGGSYIASQLVITPLPNHMSGSYSWQVPVNIIPLQFFKVAACIYTYQEFPLTQIMKYQDVEQVGFELNVQSQSFSVADFDDAGIIKSTDRLDKTIKYYTIKNGKFYFDVGKKRLIMPRYGYATELILEKAFGQATSSMQALRDTKQFQTVKIGGKQMYKIPLKYFGANLQKWGVYKYLTPSHYAVTMWDGSQAGVQVKVEANGRGPSYQVQKGAICEISADSLSKLPASGKTTPLPISTTTVYKTYQAVNNATAQLDSVPWIVYNRQLASCVQQSTTYNMNRGNFMLNLLGTQLYQKNADYWYRHIVGENCQRFIGNVTTSVILKGRPNKCLYLGQGTDLDVYAPKKKIRYIGNVQVNQRTGGLKKGLRISPSISGSQRAANGYDQPYIIVYLKQRYVDDDLSD